MTRYKKIGVALIACLALLICMPASASYKLPRVFDFDIAHYGLLSSDLGVSANAQRMEEIIRYWADSFYEATISAHLAPRSPL